MPALATYHQWADDLAWRLVAATDPPPEADVNVHLWQWLIAWAQLEDTRARFNPLATTYRFGESVDFNSAGVQSYASLYDGAVAAAFTLTGAHAVDRGYLDIVAAGVAEHANQDPQAGFQRFRDAVSRSAWSGLPRDGKHYLIPDYDPSWAERPLPGQEAA